MDQVDYSNKLEQISQVLNALAVKIAKVEQRVEDTFGQTEKTNGRTSNNEVAIGQILATIASQNAMWAQTAQVRTRHDAALVNIEEKVTQLQNCQAETRGMQSSAFRVGQLIFNTLSLLALFWTAWLGHAALSR